MKAILITLSMLCLPLLSCAVAESQAGAVDFEEENGFISLKIPLLSLKAVERNKIEVVAEGRLGRSVQRIKFQIEPNILAPRDGVTRTESSCTISFDDDLFRAFAARLKTSLSPTSLSLRPHTFDAQIVDGTLASVNKEPLKLLLIDLVHDDKYSEWYLSLDVQNQTIALSEKNNEYREPFVTTFIK